MDVADVYGARLEGRIHARRTSSSARTPRARRRLHFGKPLVSSQRGSASASEIVAGAIQDHDRGLIVGQRTWGKGLVQSVYTLPYGAGLALTTAKYYTPSGRWIQRDFTDLLAYVNPDDTDTTTGEEPVEAPRKEGEVFYTDAGRVVYAAAVSLPTSPSRTTATPSS